jgi:hypothetical protein
MAGAENYADNENLTTNKIGVLTKSFDYTIKNAQITASQNILGGIDFFRNSGTHTHIVACDGVSNADIYESVTGTWTAASQSLTATAKVRFAYSPTLDTLFACNYSDVTRSYNGSAWSTSTNVTSAPKAKFLINFGRRMVLLNCVVGATSYYTRSYHSSTEDTGSITWDTTNDWLVYDDLITGVGKNNENMFVGCENSIWIVVPTMDKKYQASNHGCVSHEGIASYGRWTFWPSSDGMYAWDGSDETKISLQIQDYWDGIPLANLSNIQAKVLGHHLIVYIGDITSPSTISNVIFDYNILQNNWNRGRLADECKHLHTYVSTTGNQLFMGNDDGEVFTMFTGEAQNTATYPSSHESDWVYGSGADQEDDYLEFWGFGDNLSGLKVFYKADDSVDWVSVGELNGSTDFVKFKKRAYRIKFMVQENSKNNLFSIHRFDVKFNPLYDKGDTET